MTIEIKGRNIIAGIPRSISLAVLVASVVLIGLAMLLAFGAFDSLSKDGRVGRDAAGAIIVYWLFFCLVLFGVASFRKNMKDGILYIAAVLVSVIVLEFSLRTFELFPERTFEREHGVFSPRFHHMLPPDSKLYQGRFEGRDAIYRINADGLRTTYTVASFQKYRKRIAVLGDSFTVGFAVRQEKAFPLVMEDLLRVRLRSNDLAVLNAGITSSSPFLQKLLYAGLVREYAPHVVFAVLDVTDFGDDYKYAREVVKGSTPLRFQDQPSDGLPYYGALYQLLSPFVEYPRSVLSGRFPSLIATPKRYRYLELNLEIGGRKETNRFFILRHQRKEIQPFLDTTLRNIQELAHEVQNDGGIFILVVTPRYQHWNPKECPDNRELWMYSTTEPHQFEYLRFFDEMKDSVSFPILNLLPAFQSTQEHPLVFDRDPHWNERGHAFVARTLTEYLIQNDLVRQH